MKTPRISLFLVLATCLLWTTACEDADETTADETSNEESPGEPNLPLPDATGLADTDITEEPDVAELEDAGVQEDSLASGDTETPQQPTTWCEASLGGAAGDRAVEQDFARAHMGIGLFSPPADGVARDETLGQILNDDALLQEEGLAGLLALLADNAGHICHLEATSSEAAEAVVEMQGTIAKIIPGSGAPTLPEGVEGVVLDLRNLSPGADVAAAAGVAFGTDLALGTRTVRRFLGLPHHGEDWTHYESNLTQLPQTLAASGAVDVPMAIVLGTHLSPEAARIAGGLRMANRARLVGDIPIFTAIAESTWSAVGEGGLLWRSSQHFYNGTPWPDVIPSDGPLSDDWASLFGGLEPVSGSADRPEMLPYNRAAGPPADALTQGTMRAALLAGYGMFDWFYPYFDLVGRDLDDALLAGLEEVNGLEDGDRKGFMHTLGRFMHDLYDGHGFYSDWASTDWPTGYLAAQIKRVNGEPVVRVSNHEGLYAGDTITSIDGVPAGEWYEEAMSRYSAASDGYRFVLATDELTAMHGTLELGLKGVKSDERIETFSPKGYLELDQVPWGGTMRENGWLTDLDAAGIYYLNMAGPVTPDVSFFFEEFSSISKSAAGIVLDMRDYPNLDIYELARYFNEAPFTAPHFGFPTWSGPEDYELTFEIWDFMPVDNPFLGPVALIVSNHSVSAAECISQMVMDLEHVTVVGQQSASTNGTITSFWIPGNIELTFTGMRLLNLDGSDFHGIGVVPDVEVTPTPSEFAAGIDPELQAAIEVLQGL